MNTVISVIIPVYKAEECLEELYKRLINSLQPITSLFEILFIEDCGKDNSWNIIEKISKTDKRIKGIQFTRNFGQHRAITAGLDLCQGDWVVVMDCDLQDRPEEIPALYFKALEGHDVVAANRMNKKYSVMRSFFSKCFYKIFNYLLDYKYDDRAGNFRIISKKVVQNLRSMPEQLRFFGGQLAWLGFDSAEISVEHAERFSGKSSYNFKKLWHLASDTLIAYSDKPLKWAILVGVTFSLIALLVGMTSIVRGLAYHTPIAGWGSLIASIYFIGGIIITMLGMIGIYLAKIFNETKQRPLYVIGKRINDP